jgi:hypothetical protein
VPATAKLNDESDRSSFFAQPIHERRVTKARQRCQ